MDDMRFGCLDALRDHRSPEELGVATSTRGLPMEQRAKGAHFLADFLLAFGVLDSVETTFEGLPEIVSMK